MRKRKRKKMSVRYPSSILTLNHNYLCPAVSGLKRAMRWNPRERKMEEGKPSYSWRKAAGLLPLFLANKRKIKDRRDGKKGGVNVILLLLFHPLCTIQGLRPFWRFLTSFFGLKDWGLISVPWRWGSPPWERGYWKAEASFPWSGRYYASVSGCLEPLLCLVHSVGEVIFDGSFENLLHSTKFLMTDYSDSLEHNSFVICMCIWGASMKSKIDFIYKFTYYFIYYYYIFI